MFCIRMLPAGYGDCLWIEYGDAKKPNRILIDAGTLPTYQDLRKAIETRLDRNNREFELFIISHIDVDHIDTAVRLLNSPSLKLQFGQAMFNGWRQLVDRDLLGPQQGEYASALIEKNKIKLNVPFDGKAVYTPDNGKLPSFTLPGGMKMTVLSPGREQLLALRKEWKKVMGKAAGDASAALSKLVTQKKYRDTLGRRQAPDVDALAVADTGKTDASVPNGSSIVVLAEYEGKRCLFGADGHPDVLEKAVERLLQESRSSQLRLDALKVPHHGSRHNNTVSLLQKLNCRSYLISTNGKIFHHPDAEAVARIIKYGGPNARLYFNYDTDKTRIWDDPALKRTHRYEVLIRPKEEVDLEITL